MSHGDDKAAPANLLKACRFIPDVAYPSLHLLVLVYPKFLPESGDFVTVISGRRGLGKPFFDQTVT